MSIDDLRNKIQEAFDASSMGTATPEQREMHSMVLSVLEGHITDPSLVGLVSKSVGSFASVYDREWSDLNPMQKWVREEAANADRATPALGSMNAVYKALVTAEKASGAGLTLGNGINVIAIDKEGRRWLLPRVSESAIESVRNAETTRDAKQLLSASGTVRYTWSIERTFLVPEVDELKERLPLPEGGSYLIVYRGDVNIIAKKQFKQAFAALAKEVPILDFLVWDRAELPATLWSVRGNMGHQAGVDIKGWPEHLSETCVRMSAFLKGRSQADDSGN